jgi:hypothetical protein
MRVPAIGRVELGWSNEVILNINSAAMKEVA